MSPINAIPSIPNFGCGSQYRPQKRLNMLHSLLIDFQSAIQNRNAPHAIALKGKIETKLGKTDQYCIIRNQNNQIKFSNIWKELSSTYSQLETLRNSLYFPREKLSSKSQESSEMSSLSYSNEDCSSSESSDELGGYDTDIGPLRPCTFSDEEEIFVLPNEAEYRLEMREKLSMVNKEQYKEFRNLIISSFGEEVEKNSMEEVVLEAKKQVALEELGSIIIQKRNRSHFRHIHGCNPEDFEKVTTLQSKIRDLLDKLSISNENILNISLAEAEQEVLEALESEVENLTGDETPKFQLKAREIFEKEVYAFILERIADEENVVFMSAQEESPISTPLFVSLSGSANGANTRRPRNPLS